MELIFGLLPPPVTLGLVAVLVIGGIILRKKLPGHKVTDTVTTVGDIVVTRDRIDKAVEAVLAKLRVNPELADRLGDAIADIVMTMSNQGRRTAYKMSQVAPVVKNQPHLVTAAAKSVAQSTLADQILEGAVEPELIKVEPARVAIMSDVVSAFVTGSSFGVS